MAGVIKVSPHTIPGALHQQNQTAFDWGWQGLVAYGCHSNVVVVDPVSVQPVQTLAQHRHNVIKVCWAREYYHHTVVSPHSLRLASVDSASQCLVWDVVQGAVVSQFLLGGKPLVDLQWLTTNDSCRDLIAVMLSPNSMTIWNADTGTKVSRFTFTETIMAFAFNPFQPENLILQSSDCFVFVSDFNPSRTPTGGGKKYYMAGMTGASPPLPGRGNSPPRLQRRLLAGDQLKGEETIPLSDYLQISFSPAHRHHLFIVAPREVIVMDLELKQAVGCISVERNASPLLRLLPCRQRDLLYCLHENGCVSVRVQQRVKLPTGLPNSPIDFPVREVCYDLVCHSEPLRISKTCHVYSGGVAPSSELRVAVLTSEGRVLFWDVEFEQVGIYGQELPSDEHNGPALPTVLTAYPVRSGGLVDLQDRASDGLATGSSLALGRGLATGSGLAGEDDEGYGRAVGEGSQVSLSEAIAPHWFTPPQGGTTSYGVLSLRLILGGLWSGGISGSPTALRMCPPLTTKNWSSYAPLVAVGTSNGSILVYNLSVKMLVKEFAVHSCTVHGIEWLNQTAFVSHAHTTPTSSGHVRSEVATTDSLTGKVTFLRRPDVPESAHHTVIDTIKISSHRNYLVVKYKDKPLEFWDTRTLTFLRELVSNPPTFACVEWSPSHSKSKSAAAQQQRSDPLSLGVSTSTVDFDMAMGATDSKMSQSAERELLTVMDDTGSMWQISIEGSKVRVGNTAPTVTYLNNPASVAWKSDFMVAGDGDGGLFLCDAKTSQVRNIETPHAAVRKLRFAPGKGNMKLFILYNSRLDIRDTSTQDCPVLGQMKWGNKDSSQSGAVVEDADWATSDKPVVITADGCVRVFDIKLQTCHSQIAVGEFSEVLFCPHAVLPQAGFMLKSLLQHQPWRVEYSLDPDLAPGNDEIEKAMKSQLQVLPERYRCSLVEASLGVPQRCLYTASLFGAEQEVAFWSVALHYLLRERSRLQDPRYPLYKQALPRPPSSDIIQPNSSASTSIFSAAGGGRGSGRSLDDLLGPISDLGLGSQESLGSAPSTPVVGDPPPPPSVELTSEEVAGMLREASERTLPLAPPLDLHWDLLCDSHTYQTMQLDRALLCDSKRQTYDQTRRCAETLLLLGQTDRAVQLLLETDTSSAKYYTDALKACLAATIRSSGASQSTIKLVATNLIANSRLMEGVQLLCLIDKGQDGCRYLQTYGEWQSSVWLAKATLSEKDGREVFSRWADHLGSVGVNQKSKALLVLLSLGHLYKVVEMLYSMRYFDRAALFAEACLDYGLLTISTETAPLLEAVFLEYARFLHSVGLTRGLRHYCHRAGDKGTLLLEQCLSTTIKSKLLLTNFSEP